MNKFLKWTVIVLSVLAVGAGIFCGLYFGVPAVHDWVNGVKPAVDQATETAAMLVR